MFAVLCIPWFLWFIVITADEAVVVIGFLTNVLTGVISLTSCTVPSVPSVNLQRLILNLTSSFCSAVHVEAFWDLNILPRYGCWEINLAPSKVVCPNLDEYIV